MPASSPDHYEGRHQSYHTSAQATPHTSALEIHHLLAVIFHFNTIQLCHSCFRSHPKMKRDTDHPSSKCRVPAQILRQLLAFPDGDVGVTVTERASSNLSYEGPRIFSRSQDMLHSCSLTERTAKDDRNKCPHREKTMNACTNSHSNDETIRNTTPNKKPSVPP